MNQSLVKLPLQTIGGVSHISVDFHSSGSVGKQILFSVHVVIDKRCTIAHISREEVSGFVKQFVIFVSAIVFLGKHANVVTTSIENEKV